MNRAKLKNYFELIHAYRAARDSNILNDKQKRLFFNHAEQAYKEVGYDFGDQIEATVQDPERRRVSRQWWDDN